MNLLAQRRTAVSLGIYPVFEPSVRGAKFKALGEVLVQEFETLDKIAQANGLTPFTAFADTPRTP